MKASEESEKKIIDPNHDLIAGCKMGNIYVVRDAVLQGADVNYKRGKPLIDTINGKGNDFQKFEILLYLNRNGAKLDLRHGDILAAAIKENILGIVKYLLEAGIRDDGTSLYNAVRNKNAKIVAWLLESKIEVQDYVREGIDDLEVMKEQNSPIKKMLDEYFAGGSHIIHETDSEASRRL